MGVVRIRGLEKLQLGLREARRIDEALGRYGERIAMAVRNEHQVTLHPRAHERDGKRRRYEVSARLEYPGDVIAVSSEGWDIVATIRDALEKLMQAYEGRKESGQLGRPGTRAAYTAAEGDDEGMRVDHERL